MSTCLINLESYSYNDYLNMNNFINETFTENKEVDRMLEEFKSIVNNLDSDIDSFDRDKVEKILSELSSKADEINKHNKIGLKTTLNVMHDAIGFTYYSSTTTNNFSKTPMSGSLGGTYRFVWGYGFVYKLIF